MKGMDSRSESHWRLKMAVGINIISGDIVITEQGTFDILSPALKCSRDLKKFLLTSIEFYGNETTYSRYNPTYGTELDNKLLYSGLSRQGIIDTVTMKLNEALNNYISLQEKRVNLDLQEVITNITFDVLFSLDDPTTLLIKILYTTLSGTVVTLENFSQKVI